MARKALYKHATQVNTSSYPDDGASPVGTNEWNEDPDPNGMLGFTPQTSTVTISSGALTPTDSITVVASESGTSDTITSIALTNTNQYDLLYLFADTGDTITLTNTSSPSSNGQVKTVSDANETLSTTKPTILIRKGNYWYGYGGGTVSDGSITTVKLAADAVTGAKLADDTIDSEHYIAASIDNEHLADNAVGTAEIAADAVTAAKLADDAVVTANVVDLNVTTAKIAADAITGAKIADDAINSEHYADGSIDNAHIADDQIDSEHYVDGSIDTAHIGDDQVTQAKVAAGAIGTTELADDGVTLAKMDGLARGKLIYGDASGNPAALAVGTADQVLTHNGTDFGWADASGGGAGDQQFWIDASAFIPVPSSTVGSYTSYSHQRAQSNGVAISSVSFPYTGGTTSESRAVVNWVPPKNWNNGTIKVKIYTTYQDGSATHNGNFTFKVSGVAISNDEVMNASFGTAVSVTDACSVSNDLHISPISGAITIGGSPADADFVQLKVARVDSSSNAMHAGSVIEFLGMIVQYTQDASTSSD